MREKYTEINYCFSVTLWGTVPHEIFELFKYGLYRKFVRIVFLSSSCNVRAHTRIILKPALGAETKKQFEFFVFSIWAIDRSFPGILVGETLALA